MTAEFSAILDHGAAAILQPDLGRAGGIREGAKIAAMAAVKQVQICLLYTSPSPRDLSTSRMPSSA